jgi:dGTPase
MLHPYAVRSDESRGRRHPENPDGERSTFQLDRDRILHCRAWRRMEGKTQVFVAHFGDHYRDRMTHSLEVAQISRDLARWLGLNEDLTEAIALAHDLGHTPFGHAGEHALNECLSKHGLAFEHNEQSRRVVEEIECVYPGHPGLNLSVEVLEGLMKHHSSWDNPLGNPNVTPSLEAQVVNLGDEIAYQNHDIDDGLRSGLLHESDLKELTLWRKAKAEVEKSYGQIPSDRIRIARTISKMMGLMIRDVHAETARRLKSKQIQNLEDVYLCSEPLVGFSQKGVEANAELKHFLMQKLYFHPEVVKHSQHGQSIIKALFDHYLQHPEEVPREETGSSGFGALRDYLAGMTDRFAEQQVRALGLQLEQQMQAGL